MARTITTCPIWGDQWEANGYYEGSTRTFDVENSARAGGGYVIREELVNRSIRRMDDGTKARLTTWLIDQRALGNSQPTLTQEVVDYASTNSALPVNERADRLLRFIAKETKAVGETFAFQANDERANAVLAWSESTNLAEIAYFLGYLNNIGCLKTRVSSDHFLFSALVTVGGYNRIAEQATNTDSSQGFVAMWFDGQIETAYEQGIRLAVEEAGYNPMRIDRKLDVEKIDDAILAEIRRSRFLIADFTHGDDGARGGVYFEAGFAMGLGIPVFFTCRSDMVTKLHFDTRQYAHIVWSTPERLRFDLRDRILARIGHGPSGDTTGPLIERPPRQPLGQWLVENMPRGVNLEIPDRAESSREIPFVDPESQ